MSRRRVSEKTKSRFKNSIRDLIKGLSDSVIVVSSINSDCTNCYFDKFTGTSTGRCKWTLQQAEEKQAAWEVLNPGQVRYKYFDRGRCPVCRGSGSITVKRRKKVDCIIIWNPESRRGNELVHTLAGSDGSTTVELKTNPRHMDIFKAADHVIVNGVRCRFSKPPSTRGIGTQAVMIITAFTTDLPKPDGGEVFRDSL